MRMLLTRPDRVDVVTKTMLVTRAIVPFLAAKCKSQQSSYRVFNLILWVLYTGMQWKCVPIPHDTNGQPAIHYTAVYKVCLRRNR